MATTALGSSNFQLPDDIHFLNRVSYGPTSATVSEVAMRGWDRVLETQLHPENIDTSAIDSIVETQFPTLGLTAKEILGAGDPELSAKVVSDLIAASLVRQFRSPAQLYERMVEFWNDHFHINSIQDRVRLFKPTDDREVIRPSALGKFRDLLHASARSPAMLLYLDNNSNTKTGPNENYARELLELHTLGVNGGYTETDVVEVARAFTGWTISRDTLEFVFNMKIHDRLEKTVLGQSLAHPAMGGIAEGNQVLDLLASHPSTAKFISTKLLRRFVSDEPSPELVTMLSEVFLDTDGDIKSLLRTIFYSDEFWASQEMKMKRPIDFLASTIRRFDISTIKDLSSYIFSQLKQMGQVPFGWHSPDGYPDTAEYWTNTAALVNRWSTAKDAAYFLSTDKYLEILGDATSPIAIIQAVAVAVIDRELDEAERISLKRSIFGRISSSQAIEANPVPYAQLVATVLMGSRYFQKR